MIFTLKYCRDEFGQFVENGICNTDTLNARINEAIRRLVPKSEQAERLKRIVRLVVRNNTFPLPRECEKVEAVDINGTPTHIFDMGYEFRMGGLGDLACQPGGCASYLKDLGYQPFMYQPPFCDAANVPGLYYMALSTEADDTGKLLTIRGTTANNEELRTGYDSGESIKIGRWQDGQEGMIRGAISTQELTTQRIKTITQVYKTVTRGYVSLFACDPTTSEMWAVAKYHPDDLTPTFRRYQILFKVSDDKATNVLTLCKIKGDIPLKRDDDIVPIDSPDAIKFMLMAISQENAGNLPAGNALETQAYRVLEAQHGQAKTSTQHPYVIDADPHLSLAGRLSPRRIR